MAIIVSQAGKNAQRLERTVIQQEDYLQQYIYANPESLPIHELEEDMRLLILAREFPTGSGPIDALGVDADGEIDIIETKLYKNTDKRLVIAQMLDYGAQLWSTYSDTDQFIAKLEDTVTRSFGIGLAVKLKEFFAFDDDTLSSYYDLLRGNVREGKFRFVVLMDRLHDRRKDLISFVNANSRFTVLGVELDFYQYQDFGIIVPRLYGAEGNPPPGSGGRGTGMKWNEESFFRDAEAKLPAAGVQPIRTPYDWCKERENENAVDISWGTGVQAGSFKVKFPHVHPTKSVFTVKSNGRLNLNFLGMRETEHSAAYARRLGTELQQHAQLPIPTDFMDRFLEIPPDQWAPHADDVIDALWRVLKP